MKTSFVFLVTAAVMTSLLACTKNKDTSGTTIITDETGVPVTNVGLTMKHTMANGNLVIYDKAGQQVGTASNVTRILGEPTENFIAFESLSEKMGLTKTIFHTKKGNVANCEQNCVISLRNNFASYKILQGSIHIAVGLVDRKGNSYTYSSRVRNGQIKQVNIQVGDDFALLTRPNGQKSLIGAEQGLITNAQNIRVKGSFALATIAGRSYLFNSNNSFLLDKGTDRLNGVLVKNNFAIVDYGVYKTIFHGTKGLIVDACNACTAFSATKSNDSVIVGNNEIMVSDNFIVIPTNNSDGRVKIFNRNHQPLTAELMPGTRIDINDYFAGYTSQFRSQLFHVLRGPIADSGRNARIRLIENGAIFNPTGLPRMVFDNNGIITN